MRVLLCHRLNLGDLVCASPGIQWAKRKWPEMQFRLFTNDFAARIGPLLPEVEQVYAYRKFDGAGIPEWSAILAARRWRPQRLIGLSPDADWRLSVRLLLLGAHTWHSLSSPRVHVAERLASQFGWDGSEPLPSATLRMPDREGRQRDVAIWISARKPSNRPSGRQVVELVKTLRARRPGLSIGIFGLPRQTGSSAHQADEDTQRALGAELADLGLRLETPPLDELFLAELASSRSVITPDGGISHVAAGFGRPVVTLFGNVPVEAWRPYMPRARALQAPSRRVADIAVRDIVAAWEECRSAT